MANAEMKKLNNLTADELRTQIRETKSSLFEKKMQLVTGQLENTASVWKGRKTLARLETLLAKKAQKGS